MSTLSVINFKESRRHIYLQFIFDHDFKFSLNSVSGHVFRRCEQMGWKMRLVQVGGMSWLRADRQALLAEAAAVASCTGEGSASRAFSGLAKKRRNERLDLQAADSRQACSRPVR